MVRLIFHRPKPLTPRACEHMAATNARPLSNALGAIAYAGGYKRLEREIDESNERAKRVAEAMTTVNHATQRSN